ncbi:MAG TPA: hypothetical protein VFX49_02110 [Chloroflexota bacterium]|nr:hypothetical protein [Chloroflexota bacterium]
MMAASPAASGDGWAERAADELRASGSLSEATFRGIVREMDRLSHAELRALVTTLLAFGPEPVADPALGALRARARLSKPRHR